MSDDDVVHFSARGGGSFCGNGGFGTYTWPLVRMNLYSEEIEISALGGLVRSRMAWHEIDHIDVGSSSVLIVMKSAARADFVAFSSTPISVVEQFAVHYDIEIRRVTTTFWSRFR